MALGKTGDERAIDEVLPVFEESPSFEVRADVVRAVVRTMERSGKAPPHAVAWLRRLGEEPRYSYYVTRWLKRLGLEQ